jgi:hypothetical protein
MYWYQDALRDETNRNQRHRDKSVHTLTLLPLEHPYSRKKH